jgi:membrane protein
VLAAVVGTSAGTAAVCATVLVSWGAGAHFLLDMNDGDRTAISCIAMAGMLWGLSMTCTADEAVIKGDRALISRGQAILRDPTILMAAFFLSSLAAGGVEATFALYDNDTYHHETIVILCLLGLAGAAPLVLARDTPLAPVFFAFTLSIWAGQFSAPDSTTVLAFQMAAIAVALSVPLMIRPRVGRAAPD